MTDLFAQWGYPSASLLGRGMDGVVYRLGSGLVGKVWHRRSSADLVLLRSFYRELTGQGLPYATPEIVAVHSGDGVVVSVERELAGTPLDVALTSGVVDVSTAYDVIVQAVTSLAGTTAGPATRALPVMGVADRPSLADLVVRRADSVLAGAVPGFAEVLSDLVSRLSCLDSGEQIVHGDICPANLLVDSGGRLVSLLDWGLLTMAGDNSFDAATAAGVFDMYSPYARRHDVALVDRFVSLGYDRELLMLHRAAYAVVGATAYDSDGGDGHFLWCVRDLVRLLPL